MKRITSAIGLLLAIILLSACSSSSHSNHTSVKTKVNDWAYSQNIKSKLRTFTQDAYTLSDDANAGNVSLVQSDCATLQADNSGLKQTLPTPDTELTHDLTESTEYVSKATQSCLMGNYNTTATELTTGAHWFRLANNDIHAIENN